MTTVAVIAAGEMGCSIGERLSLHGARVLTSLAQRSAATAERAARAGMVDADDDAIAACDFILSIVPPKDAEAVAHRFAGPLQRRSTRAAYVDCNAVSVDTVIKIAELIAASGARFVDGSIIGAPGRRENAGPTFYLAGEIPSDVATLTALGLRVRSAQGPVGAASALKMAYAGLNKGLTGLAAAMVLAATRAGAASALREELANSQPQLLAHISRALPDMYRKAHRAGNLRCARSPRSRGQAHRPRKYLKASQIFTCSSATTGEASGAASALSTTSSLLIVLASHRSNGLLKAGAPPIKHCILLTRLS